jgi:hypothetical protein
MSHVADCSRNRLFDRFSGRYTPIRPTNQRCERKGHPLSGTRESLVGLQRPLGHCSPATHNSQLLPTTLPRWLLPSTD